MDIERERKFPWGIVFGLGALLLIATVVMESDSFKSQWDQTKEQAETKSNETFDSFLDKLWSIETEKTKMEREINEKLLHVEIVTWPGYYNGLTTYQYTLKDGAGKTLYQSIKQGQ